MISNYVFLIIHFILVSVVADKFNKYLKTIVKLNKIKNLENANHKKIEQDLYFYYQKINKMKKIAWITLLILYVFFQLYSLIYMPTYVLLEEFTHKNEDLFFIFQPIVPLIFLIVFLLILLVIFWLKGASTLHSQISDKLYIYGKDSFKSPFL